MTNYDLLNQEKGLDGTALAQEHLGRVEDVLEEINVASVQKIVRKVSDLTYQNLRHLWWNASGC